MTHPNSHLPDWLIRRWLRLRCRLGSHPLTAFVEGEGYDHQTCLWCLRRVPFDD